MVSAVKRSARAILVDDHARLVVIKRTKPGEPPYWTAPSGGVDAEDASPAAALRRELAEELGASTHDVEQVFLFSFPAGEEGLGLVGAVGPMRSIHRVCFLPVGIVGVMVVRTVPAGLATGGEVEVGHDG